MPPVPPARSGQLADHRAQAEVGHEFQNERPIDNLRQLPQVENGGKVDDCASGFCDRYPRFTREMIRIKIGRSVNGHVPRPILRHVGDRNLESLRVMVQTPQIRR